MNVGYEFEIAVYKNTVSNSPYSTIQGDVKGASNWDQSLSSHDHFIASPTHLSDSIELISEQDC